MRRPAALMALLSLVCACQEAREPTQTIVWVDADPEVQTGVARVAVQAVGPDDNREPLVETRGREWPIKLVLAPKYGDATRRFKLHIDAFDERGERLLTLRFASGFVAERTRYAKLLIRAECLAQPDASCSGDSCQVAELELAASELARDPVQARVLNARCAPDDSSTPPQAGSAGSAGMGGSKAPPVTAGSPPGVAGAAGSVAPVNGMCAPGFVLRANDCVDIDDCAASNPCGDHGVCQNTAPGYDCVCEAGFQSLSGSCVDIDECQTDNGGCESTCQDLTGGVSCACADTDSWLKADGKSCGAFGMSRRLNTGSSMKPMQPCFAFDAAGNGLAAWVQSDGMMGMMASLWTRRFVAGRGWAASPSRLATGPGSNPSSPALALDPSGKGLLVWAQEREGDSDVWAARYSGDSFEMPVRIDAEGMGNSAYDPSVELDAQGDGFAVWSQTDGMGAKIAVNRFLASAGWSGARPLEITSGQAAFSPELALDARGNASLTWTQSSVDGSSGFSAWAARYDLALERWRSASPLDDNGSAGFTDSQVFGTDGNVLAVWSGMRDGRVTVRASSFTPSAGWGDAVEIVKDTSDLTIVRPRVALTAEGSGAAIWGEQRADGVQVWANRVDGATGKWAEASLLSRDDSTQPLQPQIALDATGSGFGVWSEIDGTTRAIRAARMQAGVGFLEAVTLETDMTASPSSNSTARVAVDAHGNAVVIWDTLAGGQYSVWSNTFE